MSDWADKDAWIALQLLGKATSDGERVEVLAAYLRAAEAKGAMRGVEQVASALGVEDDEAKP